MGYEEYKRKVLEPIVNYIESVMASYSKEELEARIKKALPEKESEDETFARIVLDLPFKHEADYKFVRAYLEKQKDKRELDFAEGKVEGVKQTCQEIKDAMSLFEPKDLTPFEFTFRDYIDSAIRYCLSGEGYQQYIKEWAADLLNLEKQKEQKPVWVEIDKSRESVVFPFNARVKDSDKIVTIIDGQLNSDGKLWIRFASNKDDGFKVYNPEDLLVEQRAAEWSEEDEEMIARICANLEYIIEEAGCDSKFKEILEERIKWMKRLKSLRPQPHWKPSEEQMNALFDILCPADSVDRDTLETLYDDLKKL